MQKQYEDDYELLYMISENNEEASETIFKKYESVVWTTTICIKRV